MKSLFLSLLFSVAALLMPLHVLAANYGECGYGEGKYDEGCSTPSPSPTPPPGQNSNSGSSGSSRSSGSSGSSSSGACTTDKPTSAPDLFQINVKPDTLILYFSPVITNRDRYFISYSTSESAEEHGYEFEDSSDGVVSVDIRQLQKNTIYFVKVRAGNGCQPGEWSNVMAARTGQRFPSYKWSSLPRIVSTGVKGRIHPFSVRRVEVAVGEAEPAQEKATTTDSSHVDQGIKREGNQSDERSESQPIQPTTESLFQRATRFLKRLLGG